MEEAVRMPAGDQDIFPALVHRAQIPPAEQPTGQGTGGWEDSDLGDGGWEDSVTLELTAQGSKLSAK